MKDKYRQKKQDTGFKTLDDISKEKGTALENFRHNSPTATEVTVGRVVISNPAPSFPAEERVVVRSIPEIPLTEEGLANFNHAVQTIRELRAVRDQRSFINEGFHSFREWCMAKFGEKLGGWLEEIL